MKIFSSLTFSNRKYGVFKKAKEWEHVKESWEPS